MKKLFIPFLVLAIMVSVAFAGVVFQESTATPGTNRVTITWLTKNEDGVTRFVILRSPDDISFFDIGSVTAKGAGTSYNFVDEDVLFKADQTFFYKIRAVRENNEAVDESQSLIVNPNISGIFRTWGAIKWLFR
jgi:hypothetical protein